jgi:dCTP deaminase
MALLSKAKIREWLDLELDKRLVITPLLDPDQVHGGSVDLRLGTTFVLTQRAEFPTMDATGEKQSLRDAIHKYQFRVTKNFHEKLVLHPYQLVLGVTLEYLGFPGGLGGYVLTRSSWGRLGLIIATATFVNPGFKGCLTLELLNLGEVPLVLYPGMRVAQLVPHTVEEGEPPDKYEGRYKYPTEPEFSRVYEDKELAFWGKKGKSVR